MALNFQNFDVVFSQGVDATTDDFTVIPTKLTRLENASFVEHGTVQTRGGIVPYIAGGAYGSLGAPQNIDRITNLTAQVLLEASGTLSTLAGTGVFAADPVNGNWRPVLYANPTNATAAFPHANTLATLHRAAAEIEPVDHRVGITTESDTAYSSSTQLQVDIWSALYAVSVGVGTAVANQVWYRVSRAGVELCRLRADAHTPGAGKLRGAYSPRVVSVSSGFALYWCEDDGATTSIKSTFISSTTPTTNSGTSTVVASTGSNQGNIDATLQPYTSGTAIFLAYVSGGPGQTITALKLDATNGTTISATVTSAATAVAIDFVRCVALDNPATGAQRPGYAVVIRTGVGSAVFAGVADLDNGVPAFSALTNFGSTAVGRIAVGRDTSGPNNYIWFVIDITAGASANTGLRVYSQLFLTHAVGSPWQNAFNSGSGADIHRGLGVATDVFFHDGIVYVGAYKYSSTQTTFYAVQIGTSYVVSGASLSRTEATRGNAEVVARISTLSAFASITARVSIGHQIPHVVAAAADEYRLSILRGDEDPITLAGSSVFDYSPIGVDIVKLDFAAQLNHVQLDNSTILVSAHPQFYDGATMSELGFEYYPEAPTLGNGTATNNSGAAGTYSFRCMYEWVDVNGVKHQSKVGRAASITIAGAGGGPDITLSVPTLRLTNKAGVNIVVFMTEANGSTYYRIPVTISSSLYSAVPNSLTVDQIATANVDPGAVAPIAGGEQSPDTGGIISGVIAPACKHVALHQDRLFFSGCENATEVRYSEERQVGFFPAVDPVYVLKAGAEGGRISAVNSLDDKVAVFQERNISVMFGRGPNRLGLDNSFSNISVILPGYGHQWARSACLVADGDGIWFFDKIGGFRHLSRSLSITRSQGSTGVTPLGFEVDDLVDSPVAVTFLTAKKQVRFSSAGDTLVWDTENKQWSLYTRAAGTEHAVGAVVADNAWYYVVSDYSSPNNVLYESDTTPWDSINAATTSINALVQTAWIRLAALKGFQRVRKILWLGKYVTLPEKTGLTADALTLSAAFDYVDSNTETANTSKSPVESNFDLVSGDGVDTLTRSGGWGYTVPGDTITCDIPPTPDPATVLSVDGNDLVIDGTVNFADDAHVAVVTHAAGVRGKLQLEHHMAHQKCEVVRFTLQLSSQEGGARLTGITLQLGLKRGTFKQSSSQRF